MEEQTVSSNQLSAVNHLVVLMLENRSFDHMLGFLYHDSDNVSPAGHPFEGLTGKEFNLDKNGRRVGIFKITPSTRNAYLMPGADPGEGYIATNSQIFGSIDAPSPPNANMDGFVKDFAYTLGWQSKEKNWHIVPGTKANDIMGMFTPQMLPVLSGLAKGYAVCDHWFCSVPTETLPNRAFVCAATSQGHMDDKTHSYTCPSIFGLLSKHNVGWKIYGYDSLPLTKGNFPDTKSASADHFGVFSDFRADAKNGKLAAYSFLEPDFKPTGNDQHPNYDVANGEKLIHEVYYALQKSPKWNETLLIVTYDEHGGCYDHVPPPQGATQPDSCAGEFGFDFKRFGVRVPTVLVSPRIPPGTVFRVRSKATPLDHTSILKTIEKRWGLSPLTKRDAAAPDIGDVLSLSAPRTDDPLKSVTVPRPRVRVRGANMPSHLQEVHADLMESEENPDSKGGYHHKQPILKTSGDYDSYIRRRSRAWREWMKHPAKAKNR